MINQVYKYDCFRDYKWILKVIESCRHNSQVESACNLIKRFSEKYQNETDMLCSLYRASAFQFNLIHSILK